MHEHRAVRVGDAVFADRTDEHADELAVAAAAHHEQVGALRELDEGRCRMPVYQPGLQFEVRMIGQHAGNCGVKHLADV
jgi:hypothetical protein